VEGKQEYFLLKGTVTFIRKENCMYNACPSDNCNKKVVEVSVDGGAADSLGGWYRYIDIQCIA